MVKLSLLTPTYNRQKFLPLLAEAIANQTADDFEWLVLDDTPEPVKLEGRNLKYIHEKRRMTLGEKRNVLAQESSGDILIHIDDDDCYGPQYAANMAKTLLHEKADMLMLSGFLCSDLRYSAHGWYRPIIKKGVAFKFEKEGPTPLDLAKLTIPLIHLCFGFCYAYTRELWKKNKFPEVNKFEDLDFTRSAVQGHKLFVREDRSIDVIHTVHGGSASNCFPQYLIPEFMVESLTPERLKYLHRLQVINKQQ